MVLLVESTCDQFFFSTVFYYSFLYDIFDTSKDISIPKIVSSYLGFVSFTCILGRFSISPLPFITTSYFSSPSLLLLSPVLSNLFCKGCCSCHCFFVFTIFIICMWPLSLQKVKNKHISYTLGFVLLFHPNLEWSLITVQLIPSILASIPSILIIILILHILILKVQC